MRLSADLPLTEPEATPTGCEFGASLSHRFSLWPFGTRTLRLFLLVDPHPAEGSLLRALLRSMQYEYFRSETASQTRAVRSALMAGHFVLRHHNRGTLSHAQASAAAVVAAARGPTVYVALAGEAAAFSWSAGVLQAQHTSARVGRRLGLEPEPRIALWSAPFGPGDRLVLTCGADWSDDTEDTLRDVLSSTPTEHAAARLADALVGSNGPVRVLVADGLAGGARRASAPRPRTRPIGQPKPLARALVRTVVGLLLVVLVGASPLNPFGEPRHLAQARQATALAQQAEQTGDLYAAHDLAASARELARQAANAEPVEHGPLLERTGALLDQIDRVSWVAPRLLVRLGSASANIVDVAVSADTLYTLDTAEGTVRGYDLQTEDQVPTPETLVLRAGSLVGGRPLEAPVAIEYVRGSSTGALTVVDQARGVVQLQGGAASRRSLPSSRGWQQLAGLASDSRGNLYVLDDQTGRLQLLVYPGAASRLADPPHALIDTSAGLPVEHVAALLPLEDLFVVLDDGQVGRYDREGNAMPFRAQPPEGQLERVASAAPDGVGGLYLADLEQSRIVETVEDGTFVRQFRSKGLDGLRVLRLGSDGRVLYGVGRDGILAIDLPPPPTPE